MEDTPKTDGPALVSTAPSVGDRWARSRNRRCTKHPHSLSEWNGRAKSRLWIAALGVIAILASPCHAADLLSSYDILLRPDKILVEKGERRLTLLWQGHCMKAYRISLGKDPFGPKIREGDQKTPEGFYEIDYRRCDSEYHRALHISYPNRRDQALARIRGVNPGGQIMIHGLGDGFNWMGSLHWVFNWTEGCIALTDEEIEEIWKLVPNGTPVEIQP